LSRGGFTRAQKRPEKIFFLMYLEPRWLHKSTKDRQGDHNHHTQEPICMCILQYVCVYYTQIHTDRGTTPTRRSLHECVYYTRARARTRAVRARTHTHIYIHIYTHKHTQPNPNAYPPKHTPFRKDIKTVLKVEELIVPPGHELLRGAHTSARLFERVFLCK
jgi:hypothetical protein